MLDGGAPGPAGPGICAMAGKPVGGGGGGLLCKIIKKTLSGLRALATIDMLINILHDKPPPQVHSSQPISASAHPIRSVNQKHRSFSTQMSVIHCM